MSIFTGVLPGGSNNHETTAEEVNALATDFVSEGVVGAIANTNGIAPMTGGFAVNAQGTPAMAVDVSPGIAYVQATPTGGSSQMLRVKSTATEEVTIAANSTGSTRYDWIYIKIDPDNAADPAADGSDVATLVTSRSTSNTSDNGNPPTYGYPVAVVTVANGATSITNANITDKRELATSVQDNSITTAKLADDSVTAAKIANAITDYSTSEVDTGFKWIDGKTIYKKTYSGTITASANTNTLTNLESITDLTNIIGGEGFFYIGTGNIYNSIPGYDGSGRHASISRNGTTVRISTQSEQSRTDAPYMVTVWYTK